MRQSIRKGRTIKTAAELPASAAYYNEMTENLNAVKYYEFTRFYDKDFKVIEDAQISYSAVLKGLSRIAEEQQKDTDAFLSAYKLEDLYNGFYKVIETEGTLKGLSSACNSLVKGRKF